MSSPPGLGALVKLLKVSILSLAPQLTILPGTLKVLNGLKFLSLGLVWLPASFFFLVGAGLRLVRGTLLEVMLAFIGGRPGRDDVEVVVVPGGDGREAGAGQGLGFLSVVVINCFYCCLRQCFSCLT